MDFKRFLIGLLVLISATIHAQSKPPVVIAIHGGAGTILKSNMTPELEAAYHAKLAESLEAAYAVLRSGGTSVDAVQTAIVTMENSPLFNAGKGSVFTHHKTNEMDASIMEGANFIGSGIE